MQFDIKSINLEEQKHSCIIVGIFESHHLFHTAKQLDKISNGYISNLLRKGELEGKLGQTLLLYQVPNTLYEYILLIGCGRKKEFNRYRYKVAIKNTINILNNTKSVEAICFLTEFHVQKLNTYWKVRQAIEVIKETLYVFEKFKTNKRKTNCSLQKIIFSILKHSDIIYGKHAIQHALAITEGIESAKNLGNMPPNICNTSYLSSKARSLAEITDKNIITKIIDEQQMKELGMNSYLSVGNGSKNESLMSIIEYKHNLSQNLRPIVLIGKGVTFDSGGISIKPSKNMDEMKYDMCGAGVVYGVMKMTSILKLPLNVIGILAGCENMPSNRSYRPGDILTTMSGKTVEILNTDAEGRLILCDILTYVERFRPEVVIDIATLTGACVIALGNHITGLISNHDPLARELIIASEQSDDRAWRLPLDNKFQKQLDSNFADMTNVGGQAGGAITAGCFLSRFAKKYHWAHLDIAGTAWEPGKNKGSTGRPVALLSQFLLNRAGFMKKIRKE